MEREKAIITDGVIIENHLTKTIEYSVRETEQQRTTRKKKEFLKEYGEMMGIMTTACQATGISRTAVYRWLDEDPKFRQETEKVKRAQRGEVEDRLIRAIAKDEGWAIIFYLSRIHPDYKQKQENYVIPTARTLEDLIDDAEKQNGEDEIKLLENKNLENLENLENKNKENDKIRQSIAYPKFTENTGQAREDSTVQI